MGRQGLLDGGDVRRLGQAGHGVFGFSIHRGRAELAGPRRAAREVRHAGAAEVLSTSVSGRHVHPLFRVDGYSFRERRYFTHRELWCGGGARRRNWSQVHLRQALHHAGARRRFSGYWF